MKGTSKACGSSWDGVIGMNDTSIRYGSSADGVMGRVICLNVPAKCVVHVGMG